MKLFKKSGKKQIRESVLQHQYAVYFSSTRLFKGLTLTFIGWLIAASSTVTFQHLVISNSIFVTLFFVFLSAFTPLFIWSCFKGRSFFICGRPGYITIRSLIAVTNYYTFFTSRAWISTSNTLLFSLDTLFVPVLIYIMFKKRLSSLTWIGLVTGLIGLGFVFSFRLQIHTLQNVLEATVCIISSLFMAWLIIISCYIIRDDPPLRQTLYTTFTGVVFSAIGILFTGWETPSMPDLTYMVTQGLIYSTMVMLYLHACDCIEPHVFATISHMVPLLIIFMNGIFKLYPLTVSTYIGSAVTIGGILIVILSTRFQIKEEDLILTE